MANQCADVLLSLSTYLPHTVQLIMTRLGVTRGRSNAGYNLIAGVTKKTLEGFQNFPYKILYSYSMSVWCRGQLIALLPEAVRPRAIVY